jgi:hypothetical protein
MEQLYHSTFKIAISKGDPLCQAFLEVNLEREKNRDLRRSHESNVV